MMKTIFSWCCIAILAMGGFPLPAMAQADLLLVRNSQAVVYGNEPIYYSFRVINQGPGLATNVTFTDVIPSGLNFQGFIDLSVDVSASLPPVGGTGTIVLTFPPIQAGTYREVFFKLMNNGSLPPGATVTNTAGTSSPVPDPRPGNNTATVNTTVQPYLQDISVYKAAQNEINAGGRIFYSLLIVNSNNTPAVFTLTDLLPEGTRFESLGTLPGNAVVTTQLQGNRDLVKVVLPVTTAYHFTMTAIVDQQVPGSTILENTTEVSAALPNQVPGNDWSAAATTVVPACTLTCPPNIVAIAAAGQCAALVNFSPDGNAGSCGLLTASPPSGSFFPVGNTLVQLSSASGKNCNFTVSVFDREPPVFNACPAAQSFCEDPSGIYELPPALATDQCAAQVTLHYSITGATTRSGTGNNASGRFNPGTSTISWRATDAAGNMSTSCQTMVNIKARPVIHIPDAFALASGVVANTVYVGYAPASMLRLQVQATADAPLTYAWNTGSHEAAIGVSPVSAATYQVTVEDAVGCQSSATKRVTVLDVRCGNKMDKVAVCKAPPGNVSNLNALCLAPGAVAAQLATGSLLGHCIPVAMAAGPGDIPGQDASPGQNLEVKIMASPVTRAVSLVLAGTSNLAYRISVFNSLGAWVETQTRHPWDTRLQLGQQYPPGWYFIEVSQGNRKKTLKFLKVTH